METVLKNTYRCLDLKSKLFKTNLIAIGTKELLKRKIYVRKHYFFTKWYFEKLTNRMNGSYKSTMALKAHIALLAFIMCTSYTLLSPSSISVHTSLSPAHASQILLTVQTSQRPVCTSHLSLSPSKVKYHCTLFKYWYTVLKTSIAQAFSTMALTAHCALLESAVCTSYHHSALLEYQCALLRGQCVTHKNQHFSDIYQCTFLMYHWALLK